jgi:hypothetical protein
MLSQNVKERDRLVAGRLLLQFEYPCSRRVLAREHQIGRATIAEIKNRFLSQDEKNQAMQAARDFYASRAQDYAQFAGIVIT